MATSHTVAADKTTANDAAANTPQQARHQSRANECRADEKNAPHRRRVSKAGDLRCGELSGGSPKVMTRRNGGYVRNVRMPTRGATSVKCMWELLRQHPGLRIDRLTSVT